MTRAAALLVLGLATTGCGSSPNASFYALFPIPGPARPVGIHAIRLRRPGLPGYLDRPEIVRRVVDHRLALAANDRWGAPLEEMIGRVLAEDVQLRLDGSSVYTEDGPITADPDATLEVDVRRFDIGERGELVLVAEVAVERDGGQRRSTLRGVQLTARPIAGTTSAFVATMSDLLGQLADRIAALVREGSG